MPRAKGATQLRAWLVTNKMNQREFAAMVQQHWTHINQILSGRRKPSLALAVNLHAVTGIPVDCWMTPQETVADAERRIKAAQLRKRERRVQLRSLADQKRAEVVAAEAAHASTGAEAQMATDEQVHP